MCAPAGGPIHAGDASPQKTRAAELAPRGPSARIQMPWEKPRVLDQAATRRRYSPEAVSISMRSPVSQNSGTEIS